MNSIEIAAKLLVQILIVVAWVQIFFGTLTIYRNLRAIKKVKSTINQEPRHEELLSEFEIVQNCAEWNPWFHGCDAYKQEAAEILDKRNALYPGESLQNSLIFITQEMRRRHPEIRPN
jgi:biopolymer transport protein ExbB/TolQ